MSPSPVSKRILVTGAGGQVGTALMQSSSHHQLIGAGRTALDISNADQVERFFQQNKPDLVINPAAYTAVDAAESNSELAYAVNANGVANLARACAKANIPIFHISTDYVFDGEGNLPITEEDGNLQPLCVYGASKLAGEKELWKLWHKHLILRVSWVFGDGKNFVNSMLRLGAEHETLNVVADQWGRPTAAADIAALLLQLADLPEQDFPWGIYHYGGTPATNWHGFAETIFAKARAQGIPLKVNFVKSIPATDYPQPAKRPANSVLSLDKIQQTFHIQPSHWSLALGDMLENHQKNQQK